MMIPSDLLLRYFDIAQTRLQILSSTDDLDDYTLVGATSLPLNSLLSRHRLRIVEAQLAALEETITEWEHDDNGVETGSCVSHKSMRDALQKIGSGDYSCVLFSSTNNNHYEDINTLQSSSATSSAVGLRIRSTKLGICDYSRRPSTCEIIEDRRDTPNRQEIQELLFRAVEQTNEIARQAFARSVLIVEWRNYQSTRHKEKKHLPQSEKESMLSNNGNVDDGSIMEHCGMMMAAVQLSEVQQFLRTGTMNFLRSTHAECSLIDGFHGRSVDDRLLHIQRLYWRALGYDPGQAMEHVNRLVSIGCTKCSEGEDSLRNNAKIMETLETYASAMILAVTNASITGYRSEDYPKGVNDDGTTRVVSVSYSEKIMTLPHDALDGDGRNNNGTPHPSLSAPTCNAIYEHASSQQRSDLNAAKATSVLQQQIWDEFQLLDPQEQTETLEAAKIAHCNFLEKVANTPLGAERTLLIQRMDSDVQHLLMIYKLWSSHSAAVGTP